MSRPSKFDSFFVIPIGFLIALSVFILWSVAPQIFPGYLFVIILGIIAFIIFSYLDFDIISLFSKHFYIGSVILLVLTLLIGRLTRGVVRWLPLGTLTLQVSEIIKPFLLVFFANYLVRSKLDLKGILKALGLMAIPLFLIVVQPSLGVTLLLAIGFVGILLAANIKKRYFLYISLTLIVIIPIFWYFLAPYQKGRITAFMNPYSDPNGAGYNSIQSQITVGTGKFFGRGLGKGNQTQLSFLPEKRTDFVFAAISEELGFIGSILTIIALFLVLWRITVFMNRAASPEARMYLAGLFMTLTAQTVIHIGMNMGVLPITGVTLPLVSAGGSSFLATMIGLGIASGARKR